ncbi:MAG: VCBS repeat-containing protein [Clostridia bacterium]|nr:VCBS repeat-containing protein [Clostridia bacterium]
MKKRTVSVFAILIAFVIFLSGCEALTLNSPENLVRPPKLSGEDGKLQEAFEKAVSEKGEYILKYPSAGEYRSAYIRYDCDNDGNDEAFVFYSLKTEEMLVHMYMLDYAGDEWIPVSDTPGEGNDVYSIEFCDLNSDGIDEIFVGWSSIDSKANKKLSVFCSQKNSQELNYNILAIESYTAMYITDLDYDSEKEILLALINSTSDTYTTEARLLKMSESDNSGYQISAVGQVSLFSGTTSIMSITAGRADGTRYLYVDEVAGDAYLTEMLYWDRENNTLASAITFDVISVASSPTSRSLPLLCRNIDRDDEIEIPVTTLLQDSSIVRKKTQGTEVITITENVYITHWKKFNDGNFTIADSYIKNEDDGFIIKYDEDRMSDWCVRFYPDEGMSQFFLRNNTENPDADNESVLLFTISAVDVTETISESTLLATGKNYQYAYKITETGEEYGITRSEILSFFSISE